MIRKSVTLFPLFLLAGCPGPGDRLPDKVPAQVTFSGNNVCITYPVTPGDYITSVQIGSDQDDFVYEVFNDKPVHPARNQCLPLFEYHFKANKNYTLYYGLNNKEYDFQKLIHAAFVFPDSRSANTDKNNQQK
ncbi:putative T6SS immunity periplasmic lipoprotein [Cronobacter malonaticus]|uniref:putative T6SS immunity periplasmic lipoprotein n=1 Tax=Cronobacter malonaticus TaxID=413503 RepID=UPI000A91EEE6|nr:putative T6SS immunity periplasmic lipoprotein [Cronobacter malonaticus]